MKNAMLKAIPKVTFQRLVIEATNEFKKVYDNGLDVVGTVPSDKLSGVKTAIADSSMGADLKTAMLNIINVAISGAATTATRKPSEEEKAKQFLPFVSNACVVPLRNRNHHAYTIGDPVIMVHGSDGVAGEMFGLDKRGCIINKSNTACDGLSHLPRLRKSLRPATASEIFNMVDRLYA